MNSGQEIPRQLVVTGGDPPEVLEAAEAALDDVSSLVGSFVEAMKEDAVGLVGMTGLAPRLTISARNASPSYPLSAISARMGGASARTSGAAAMSASWPGVR